MTVEKNNIDTIFKEKLQKDTPPPPNIWENIRYEIEQKKKRRKFLFFISLGAVASILLFILLLPLFERVVISPTIITAEDTTTITYPKQEKEQHIKKTDTATKQFVKIYKKQRKVTVESRKKEKKKKRTKISPITATPLLVTNIKQLNREKNKLKKEQKTIKENVESWIDDNYFVEQTEEKRKRWELVGQFATSYTNEQTPTDYAKGMVNVGGSVKIGYALSKRLTVQTGVSYSRYSQEYGSPKNLKMESPTSEYFSTNSKSGRELPSHTSAGRLLQKNNTMSDASYALFNATPTNMEQAFGYIEIPILLQYNLLEHRLFDFFIKGGIGINRLISNNVYDTNNGRNKIGQIEGLRMINYTSQLGVGLEYQLNSVIKIHIEPTLKYHLKSLNTDTNFNYKPYAIGVYTGLKVNF